MNNTTIRLATVAVVVVMGAFAIALAQHDSRQRGRDTDVGTSASTEPVKPLVVEGEWGAQLPQLPELPDSESANATRLASYSQPPTTNSSLVGYTPTQSTEIPRNGLRDSEELNEAESYSDDSLPDQRLEGESQGYAEYENDSENLENSDVTGDESLDPLQSTARAILGNGEPSHTDIEAENDYELPQSRVVSAAAQEPLLPQTPPAWLGDAGTPTATNAPPQLPNASELPSLPSFPLGPSANGSASNQPTPSFPAPQTGVGASGGASNVSLGIPQLPSTTPRTGYPANDLSDTQRGAMQPTNMANPAFPNTPSSLPSNAGLPTNPATASGGAVPSSSYGTATQTSASNLGGLPATSVGSSRSIPASVPQASLASLLSDVPGNRYLEGSQNPIMLIQKRAPEEIQVGKPATFVITVRNAGNATAHEVTVVDTLPRGTHFVDATPPTQPANNNVVTWNLGQMAAGDERTISLQLVPDVEGELGSMALVSFAAQASVRTLATQPRVEVTLNSSEEVLIGNSQPIQVTITNTGTGIAHDVRLEADIPTQLRHESGEQLLVAGIGNLRPNESKRLTLTATAVQAGTAQCVVRAVTNDGTLAEQSATIQVKSPQLVATIEGPARRYLERQATYRINLQNTGTAAATNLDFVIHLPRGLRFINLDIPRDKYNFDTQSNTVKFGLEELVAGKVAPINLTVLPVEVGQQIVKFNATGALGVTAEAKGQVQVEGLAELAFTIGQDNGTVEVGATTTYSVQIANTGDQVDRQVQLLVQLPTGAELLDAEAPVEYRVEGQNLVFAPLAELKSKDQHIYRFQVRHNTAGGQKVRTQLTSANWPVAVVKEEGTLVYDDN